MESRAANPRNAEAPRVHDQQAFLDGPALGNPFPLLEPRTVTYAQAQLHAEQVDAWLGLETEKTEQALRARLQAGSQNSGDSDQRGYWLDLPVKALLTPYTEIREMLSRLTPKAGETLVDLGAGYGRMGFVIGHHYPRLRFVGYECVSERVREGKRALSRFSYANVFLDEEDLSRKGFQPVSAEYYFIYDFGSRANVQKVLSDLQAIARTKGIVVIGRGRLSRDLIEKENPWLSQVVGPEHFGHYSIYRSAESTV